VSFKNAPSSMPPNIESVLAPVHSRLISHVLGDNLMFALAMITNLGLNYEFLFTAKRPTVCVTGLWAGVDSI
jgi:hypothetical protein